MLGRFQYQEEMSLLLLQFFYVGGVTPSTNPLPNRQFKYIRKSCIQLPENTLHCSGYMQVHVHGYCTSWFYFHLSMDKYNGARLVATIQGYSSCPCITGFPCDVDYNNLYNLLSLPSPWATNLGSTNSGLGPINQLNNDNIKEKDSTCTHYTMTM